jgi:hypothetical protein
LIGSGIVQISGSTSTFDGTTNSFGNTANVQVDGGSSLTLLGTIDNAGVVGLLGYASYSAYGNGFGPAALLVDGSVTLQGGGQIALWDGARYGQYYGDTTTIYQGHNSIASFDTPATLVNVDNTLIGGGQIGDSYLTLVNQAGGVIEAAAVGNNPNPNQPIVLTLDTGTNTIVNAGLMEATEGTTLQINSAVTNPGTIEVTGGSTVVLSRDVGGCWTPTLHASSWPAPWTCRKSARCR